jgi:acetyltransferase-like isoleucine patch superfamily enzyme
MTLFVFVYKGIIFVKNRFYKGYSKIVTYIKLYGNGVIFKNFNTNGIPYIMVSRRGFFRIGKHFIINNELHGNPIGRPQKCIFFVDKGAKLTIGNNVGMSSTAIVCHINISIADNVKIGGGTCIYDTDFHSLNSKYREINNMDKFHKVNKPIIICENVFVGSNSTILKGVTIGRNSIIGACSVVTKNIPDNEIWGGNPARFLKKII